MAKRLEPPVPLQRFGRLRVMLPGCLWKGGKKSRGIYDLCLCDCGQLVPVQRKSLHRGATISCGCRQKEALAENCKARLTTHGHSKDKGLKGKTYKAWRSMLQRCYNPNDKEFHNYGGRGVRVCDRWNPAKGGSYENFLSDMGLPPTSKHSIDKDKLGDGMLYSPETCCWLTVLEQSRLRRTNVFVTYNGQEMILLDACRLAGLNPKTVYYRRWNGWAEADWLKPAGYKRPRYAYSSVGDHL